jgi:hypothetical protein
MIAHRCNEKYVVVIAVRHPDVRHIERLRFNPRIVIDNKTAYSLQSSARYGRGGEDSL